MIEKEKYIEAVEVAQDRFNRIQKAIDYIETIRDNTPSSTRKDFTKMILINYEQLLDILKGNNIDIPGFEGTLEELDNLSIRGNNDK